MNQLYFSLSYSLDNSQASSFSSPDTVLDAIYTSSPPWWEKHIPRIKNRNAILYLCDPQSVRCSHSLLDPVFSRKLEFNDVSPCYWSPFRVQFRQQYFSTARLRTSNGGNGEVDDNIEYSVVFCCILEARTLSKLKSPRCNLAFLIASFSTSQLGMCVAKIS